MAAAPSLRSLLSSLTPFPASVPLIQVPETLGVPSVAFSAADLDLPTSTLGDGLPSPTDTADTVHVTNSSLSLSLSNEATLTSAPSSSTSGSLSLPGIANLTTCKFPSLSSAAAPRNTYAPSPSPSARQSSSLFTNGTLIRSLFTNSTSTTLTSSSSFSTTSDSFSSTTTDDSGSVSVEVVVVTATEAVGGGAAGDGAAATAIPPATSPSASTGSSGLPKETQNAVIGGVVGSVAGIAIIVMLAMIFLKWRRKQGAGALGLHLGDSSVMGRSLPPAPGDGGAGGGAMAERAAPFLMPATLYDGVWS